MSDNSFLDGEEFAAIRDAIASSQARQHGPVDDKLALEAMPIALLAEDRAAERALPDGQRIVERWLPEVRHVLGRLFGKELEISLGMAEAVDPVGIKRSLQNSWITRIELAGRRGTCLLAISGPILEASAIQRFGGEVVATGTGRAPSVTILSLFAVLGHALSATLGEAWKEVQGCTIEFAQDDIALERGRRSLELAKFSIVIEVVVKGSVEGSLRIVSSPEMLAAPPRALDAVPAEPGAIGTALGSVPALIRVEMGRTRIALRDLLTLTPGQVLTLDHYVGDVLPVRCAGRLVAQGKAIISRGTLAVEIVPPEL